MIEITTVPLNSGVGVYSFVHRPIFEKSKQSYINSHISEKFKLYGSDVDQNTYNYRIKQLGFKEGYIGSPSRADADYGRWFFNEIVKFYVESTINLYRGKKLLQLPKSVKSIINSLF